MSKQHLTISIDTEILEYARTHIPKREMSETIEKLLIKYADEKSCKAKERESRTEYLISEIIPEIERCSNETDLTKLIGNDSFYSSFLKQNTQINLTRNELTECIVYWAKSNGVEI